LQYQYTLAILSYCGLESVSVSVSVSECECECECACVCAGKDMSLIVLYVEYVR